MIMVDNGKANYYIFSNWAKNKIDIAKKNAKIWRTKLSQSSDDMYQKLAIEIEYKKLCDNIDGQFIELMQKFNEHHSEYVKSMFQLQGNSIDDNEKWSKIVLNYWDSCNQSYWEFLCSLEDYLSEKDSTISWLSEL